MYDLFEEWRTQNYQELKNSFIDSHKDEFDEYCKELYKSENS